MATEAICDGCGRTWKVPDASRTYKCKNCGGKVAAAAEESAPAPAASDPRRAKTVQRRGVNPLAADDAEQPRKKSGRSSNTTKFAIIGGVVAVLIGVVAVLSMQAQAATHDERLDAFTEAWASAPLDDLKPFFGEDFVAARWSKVGESFDRRGWRGSRPRISGANKRKGQDNWADIQFSLAGGKVDTRWERIREEWYCTDLHKFPRYDQASDPPSGRSINNLNGIVETFRNAWNEKSVQGVTALTSQSEPPDWISGLAASFEKHAARLPLEREPQIEFLVRIECRSDFLGADGGKIRARWREEEDRWVLQSIGSIKPK